MMLKKPAKGGLFSHFGRVFSESQTGWLTSEDSNFHIANSKKPLKYRTNFRCLIPNFGLEIFAAASCGI